MRALTTAYGTHSSFAELHKSVSYRGLICRVCTGVRPVGLDPMLTLSPLTKSGSAISLDHLPIDEMAQAVALSVAPNSLASA